MRGQVKMLPELLLMSQSSGLDPARVQNLPCLQSNGRFISPALFAYCPQWVDSRERTGPDAVPLNAQQFATGGCAVELMA
jgi:hypothetical protein